MYKNKQLPFFDELPFWSAPFGLTLLNTIKIHKGINILDIGSGTGFPVLELSQIYGDSSKVFGIEPRNEVISIINKKIEFQDIKNVKIIKGIAERLPFDDEYFDLIVSNNGINNVQNQAQVLSECYRVAKMGTQFTITVNLPETLREFYTVLFKILRKSGMENLINEIEYLISTKRKSIEYWKETILNSGFSIISIKKFSFKYRYADGSTFLNNWFVHKAFVEPIKNIISDENIGHVLAKTETELNAISKVKGELIMTIPYICVDCNKL